MTCSIFLFVEPTKTIKISFSYIHELLAHYLVFDLYSFCPLSFLFFYQFVLCFSCSFFSLHNLFIFILHSQFSLSYAPSFYEHYAFLYFLDLWLFAPLCYINVLSFWCNCSCTLVLQKHYILVIISSINTMFSYIASTIITCIYFLFASNLFSLVLFVHYVVFVYLVDVWFLFMFFILWIPFQNKCLIMPFLFFHKYKNSITIFQFVGI